MDEEALIFIEDQRSDRTHIVKGFEDKTLCGEWIPWHWFYVDFKGCWSISIQDFPRLIETGHYPLCLDCETIARDMAAELESHP